MYWKWFKILLDPTKGTTLPKKLYDHGQAQKTKRKKTKTTAHLKEVTTKKVNKRKEKNDFIENLKG